jgi:acetyl esterase/lipase
MDPTAAVAVGRTWSRPLVSSLVPLAHSAALAAALVAFLLPASASAATGSAPNQTPSCTADATHNVTPNNLAPGALVPDVDDSVVHVLPAGDATAASGRVVATGPVTYRWGRATWLEPSIHCASMSQVFQFWPATGGDANANHPTIVYFHPNGTDYRVWPGSVLHDNVVLPATAAGFNFISVEFRHPVIDQYLAPQHGGRVYQRDTGHAIQFLRAHAAALKISTNNLFAFGYSRGSLALWQALQPDLGGGTTGRPSSLVSAFVGYQAQTSYQCDQYGTLFLQPDDPQTPVYVQGCKDQNTYWRQFTSAIDSVTKDSLPVRLQYQLGFELATNSHWKIQRVTAPWLLAHYEPVHYPDYGIALYDAYNAAGNPRMAYPQNLVPESQQFVSWQSFILPLVRPDAP